MSRSIVFLGTSSFAVPALRALAADDRFQIDLVITQPDRPVGRNQTLTPPPVKLAAEKLSLPVMQPETIKSLTTDHLLARRSPTCPSKLAERSGKGKGGSLATPPDYLIVISYGQILPQSVLDLPGIAPINVHASLLPLLRGASPIQNAILQNFRTTGVTAQRMVQKLDAGPILTQKSLPIDPRETFISLHDKLAEIGAALLLETLAHPLKEIPQDESLATVCRKLKKEVGIADPATMTAAQIDRMVRALTPWPGVTIRGNKILETALSPAPDALEVPCTKNATLFIVRIQPPGGTPMTGQEFARGRTL